MMKPVNRNTLMSQSRTVIKISENFKYLKH